VVHDEVCAQGSVDHSRVGEMLRMKVITHPAPSLLTRSLGNDVLLPVDVYRNSIARGYVWVLCTGGLWDVVGSADVMDFVAAFVGMAGNFGRSPMSPTG